MKNLSVVKSNYIDYINKIISNNHLSHSYLIEVGNYDDDLKFVYDFIKMILCNMTYNELSSSDNKIIKLIDSDNYPDLIVIEPDGNNIKKGQLLSLQKEFSNKSLFGNKRIYIIKECEKLNISSANTILKFLEEPEDDIVAFLLTKNRYQVIDTIISRCQILNLRDCNYLIDLDDDIINLLDVIFNPKKFYMQYNYFISNIILDKQVAKEKFTKVEEIIVDYLNNKYRGLEIDQKLNSLFINVSDELLVKKISILEKEIMKLDYNINYKLWVDCLFSKLSLGG